MTIRVSGKGINIGDALRERVLERVAEVMTRYFDGGYSGHITVSKDRAGFRTDCAFHLDGGMTLEAEASAADAYSSADQALVMLEKRLRRYKSRLKDRHGKRGNEGAAELGVAAPSYVIEAPPSDSEDEMTAFHPVIIAESTTSLKQCSVSEAVMELDLSGAPVLVFRHGGNGRMNIIYRRPDGNIGWIDPPAGG